jgi:hypothetical protein
MAHCKTDKVCSARKITPATRPMAQVIMKIHVDSHQTSRILISAAPHGTSKDRLKRE